MFTYIPMYLQALPSNKPKIPLELYEFEACPFCRKVREALTLLDLDAIIYPCPSEGIYMCVCGWV
jgi:hypothetical protein